MTDDTPRLVRAGMTRAEAAAKAGMFGRARDAIGIRGRDAAFAVFVPGRIEVLGKHTDYAGGRSLLCAVERGVCLVARARLPRRGEDTPPKKKLFLGCGSYGERLEVFDVEMKNRKKI